MLASWQLKTFLFILFQDNKLPSYLPEHAYTTAKRPLVQACRQDFSAGGQTSRMGTKFFQ